MTAANTLVWHSTLSRLPLPEERVWFQGVHGESVVGIYRHGAFYEVDVETHAVTKFDIPVALWRPRCTGDPLS